MPPQLCVSFWRSFLQIWIEPSLLLLTPLAKTSDLAVQPLDLGLRLAVAFNHDQVEMQLANLLVDSLRCFNGTSSASAAARPTFSQSHFIGVYKCKDAIILPSNLHI
jgi:hypothetical protein